MAGCSENEETSRIKENGESNNDTNPVESDGEETKSKEANSIIDGLWRGM